MNIKKNFQPIKINNLFNYLFNKILFIYFFFIIELLLCIITLI